MWRIRVLIGDIVKYFYLDLYVGSKNREKVVIKC